MTEVPLRLRDLDPDTILWLDRINEQERKSLIWCSHMTQRDRDRLEQFLELPPDQFNAGLSVVKLWVRLWWLGKTGTWIIGTVAALLLALTQIGDYLGKWRP